MHESVYESPLYGDLDFLNKNLSEIHNRLAEISKFLEIIVVQVCKIDSNDINFNSIHYGIEGKETFLSDRKYMYVKHDDTHNKNLYIESKGE